MQETQSSCINCFFLYETFPFVRRRQTNKTQEVEDTIFRKYNFTNLRKLQNSKALLSHHHCLSSNKCWLQETLCLVAHDSKTSRGITLMSSPASQDKVLVIWLTLNLHDTTHQYPIKNPNKSTRSLNQSGLDPFFELSLFPSLV